MGSACKQGKIKDTSSLPFKEVDYSIYTKPVRSTEAFETSERQNDMDPFELQFQISLASLTWRHI